MLSLTGWRAHIHFSAPFWTQARMNAEATTAAFRFGYGLPLSPDAPQSPAAMLAALAAPDAMAARYPIPTFDWLHQRTSDMARNKQASESDPLLAKRLGEVRREIEKTGYNAFRATMARAIDATDGFRERLLAFWADHFTVVSGGQAQALTPYWLCRRRAAPPTLRAALATCWPLWCITRACCFIWTKPARPGRTRPRSNGVAAG